MKIPFLKICITLQQIQSFVQGAYWHTCGIDNSHQLVCTTDHLATNRFRPNFRTLRQNMRYVVVKGYELYAITRQSELLYAKNLLAPEWQQVMTAPTGIVSLSFDEKYLCCLQSTRELEAYCADASNRIRPTFTKLTGYFRSIAVNNGELFALRHANKVNSIYYAKFATSTNLEWKKLPGGFNFISLSSVGEYLCGCHYIYSYKPCYCANSSIQSHPNWMPTNKLLTQISITNNGKFAGLNGRLFYGEIFNPFAPHVRNIELEQVSYDADTVSRLGPPNGDWQFQTQYRNLGDRGSTWDGKMLDTKAGFTSTARYDNKTDHTIYMQLSLSSEVTYQQWFLSFRGHYWSYDRYYIYVGFYGNMNKLEFNTAWTNKQSLELIVSCAIDGAYMLYINGILFDVAKTPVYYNNETLSPGLPFSSVEPFTGTIHRVMLWNEALSEDQVKHINRLPNFPLTVRSSAVSSTDIHVEWLILSAVLLVFATITWKYRQDKNNRPQIHKENSPVIKE